MDWMLILTIFDVVLLAYIAALETLIVWKDYYGPRRKYNRRVKPNLKVINGRKS